MKTYIYFHICCINNYETVFYNLMDKIKNSGLYDVVTEIRCFVLGECNMKLFNDPKIVVRKSATDLNLYEIFTINELYKDSIKEDFNVLYIHTKGVTRSNAPTYITIQDWVNYLSYFNIEKYQGCLQLLNYYDTVGVNLNDTPKWHYSGNFWWSKSEYIRKLDLCKNETYNSPEFWLTEKQIGKYSCLWRSNKNHYNVRYTEDNYRDKDIMVYEMNFT
jgi:hypothetical protein